MRSGRNWSLSRRGLEYLETILLLGGDPVKGKLVKFNEVAREVGVSAPTVSIMLRRLHVKGYVDLAEKVGVKLTWGGVKELASYCRKKGLLEVALSRAGVTEDDCESISEELSLYLTREAEGKLYDALGRPHKCPHLGSIPRYESEREDLLQELINCCGIRKKLKYSLNSLGDY